MKAFGTDAIKIDEDVLKIVNEMPRDLHWIRDNLREQGKGIIEHSIKLAIWGELSKYAWIDTITRICEREILFYKIKDSYMPKAEEIFKYMVVFCLTATKSGTELEAQEKLKQTIKNMIKTLTRKSYMPYPEPDKQRVEQAPEKVWNFLIELSKALNGLADSWDIEQLCETLLVN